MLSTVLELAGFAAFCVAAFLIAGTVAALAVVGVECLLVALALEQGARVARPRPGKRPGK